MIDSCDFHLNNLRTSGTIGAKAAFGRPIEEMMRRVPILERIAKAVGQQSSTSLAEILGAVTDSLKQNRHPTR